MQFKLNAVFNAFNEQIFLNRPKCFSFQASTIALGDNYLALIWSSSVSN